MRHSTLLLGFALLMACEPATYSAGQFPTEEASSANDDVSSDTTATTSCGPASCAGCCQAGRCIEQPTAMACGAQGQACSSCPSGAECVQGQCQAATMCNPTTWSTGCCASDGTFQPGTAQGACGTGGEACASCGANEVCLENRCTVPPSTKKVYQLVLMNGAIGLKGTAICAGDAAGEGLVGGAVGGAVVGGVIGLAGYGIGAIATGAVGAVVGGALGLVGGAIGDSSCDPVVSFNIGGTPTWSDRAEDTNAPTWDQVVTTAEDVTFEQGISMQMWDMDTIAQMTNLCSVEYTPTAEDFTKSEIKVPCVNTGLGIADITFRFVATKAP